MSITWKTVNGTDWCYNDSNNRCSVLKFGSKEAAEEALKSLYNCSNCSNCSYCFGCSYCSNCSCCFNCSCCSCCSYCSNCSNCSYCSDCYRCYSCINCSHCSKCSNRNGQDKAPPTPKLDKIHQQVYAAASQPSALDMDYFHTCTTTHCRAGWVVTLAGDPGRELEKYYGTALAALKIYRQSSPLKVEMNKFFDTDEEALKDMKRLAEEEKTNAEA